MAKRRSAKKQRKKRVEIAIGIIVLLGAVFLAAAPKLNLPFEVPAWSHLTGKESVSLAKAAEQPVSVHFLDVGQGDCILIKSGGTAMLVDAGEADNGTAILSYLKKQGVERLAYAVCTHPHSDHIGGMAAVLNAIPVETVLMPKLPDSLVPTTMTYQKFLKAVSSSGARAKYAKSGDTFSIGEASVQVFGPRKDYDDLNNESLVLRLSYGSTSFLLTGDQEAKAEKDLLSGTASLSSDVLKCGHHGSKTSTSAAFLEAVNPKIAVISCGEDNDYGHPNAQTLNRLNSSGITVLRTDQSGAIVIGTDGKVLYSAVQKEREAA